MLRLNFTSDIIMLNQLLNKVKEQSSQLNPSELWKEHSGKIEKQVIDGLLGLAEDKLVNEVEIRAVIAKVYDLLPTPVRLVLPRDFMINKILEQKGPLLQKVSAARAKSRIQA